MMLILAQTAYLKGVYIALLVLSILVAIAVSVTASLLIVRVVKRVRWRAARRSYALKLNNDGNVNGEYLLKAEDDFGELNFSYYSNGKKMKPREETAVGRYVSKQPKAAFTQQKTEFVPVETAKAENERNENKSLKGEVKEKSQQAQENANKVMGKGRIMVSILGTLGSLLPGELGSSLKDSASSMQGRLQAADNAMGKPEMMIRQVESVESQAGSLTGKKSKREKKKEKKKDAKESVRSQPAAAQNPALQVSAAVEESGALGDQMEFMLAGTLSDCISISGLKPGETRTIELWVEPKNPFLNRTYAFDVLVQQIEQEKFRPETELSLNKFRENLVFTKLADRYKFFSIAMSVLGILIIIVLNGVWVLTVVNALSTKI